MTFAWTDESIERLKGMVAAKMRASEIAAELGDCSRSAVLGKVFRLGLGLARWSGAKAWPTVAPKPVAVQRAAPPKPEPAPVGRPPKSRLASVEPPAAPPADDGAGAPVIALGSDAVSILDLRPLDQRCRFPLWRTGARPPLERMLFCGAPAVEGRSWCACHLGVVTVPFRTRAA